MKHFSLPSVCWLPAASFVACALLNSALWFPYSAVGQPSAFTYQGRLDTSGRPSTGLYDLQFTLYDASASGHTVGTPVAAFAAPVTNGLFSAVLDFGASAFDGSVRFLEIAVRPAGSTNDLTVLTPRQLLSSTPYAIQAASASALRGTVTNAQFTGLTMHDPVADGSIIVTNWSAIGGNPNTVALVFPTSPHTNLETIIFQGPDYNHCQFQYWPFHGGVYGPYTPELVREINGSFCDYYYWYQWGDPSNGHGPEWWWWVSGAPGNYYTYAGVTYTNLFDCQNLELYEARAYTNTGGSAWVNAGSASQSQFPATLFRATSTNGSGAWIWYDAFDMTPVGVWPFSHRNYDTAKERFRITAGPDGGATLKGPMMADDFRLSNGQSITNAAPGIITGFANLASGAATILNTNVSARSIVLLTYSSWDGTIASIGEDLSSRLPGTSFKIKSSNTADTNGVSWAILPDVAELRPQ